MWQHLTQPQATLLSGILTVIAALGGVWLAWRLFSEKVKDLKGALEESGKLVAAHRDAVAATLTDIQGRLAALDEQSRTTSARLGSIQGTVEDIETAQVSQELLPVQENLRDRMRERWSEIRDRLETLATSSEIDGRTRAKYARIDRRNYASLIDSMDWDENLVNADAFKKAVEIWHRYRNGRSTPSAEDDASMARLHREIIAIADQGDT